LCVARCQVRLLGAATVSFSQPLFRVQTFAGFPTEVQAPVDR